MKFFKKKKRRRKNVRRCCAAQPETDDTGTTNDRRSARRAATYSKDEGFNQPCRAWQVKTQLFGNFRDLDFDFFL
jgi:hypothetical protein